MENITELENNVSGSKVSRKSFFIKLFFILIVLVILGILGFVFRDRIKDLTTKPSELVVQNQENGESPFYFLINSSEDSFSNPDIIEDFISYNKEISGNYYLNERYNGKQVAASFQGFEGRVIIARLIGKDISEEFSLSDDFLLTCSSELILSDIIYSNKDFNEILIKSEDLTDEQKTNLLNLTLAIPFEKKELQLKNYGHWVPMVLGLSSEKDGTYEINFIRLFTRRPSICYEQ